MRVLPQLGRPEPCVFLPTSLGLSLSLSQATASPWEKLESQEGAPGPHPTPGTKQSAMGRCPVTQAWRTKPELLPEKAGRVGKGGCQEEALMTVAWLR